MIIKNTLLICIEMSNLADDKLNLNAIKKKKH